MRRRSRTSGEVAKRRRRKATPEHRNAPKRVRPHSSSPQGKIVSQLTLERDEALEQLSEALERQTATSEVLQVISSSPGELKSVFEVILENATRICEATSGPTG